MHLPVDDPEHQRRVLRALDRFRVRECPLALLWQILFTPLLVADPLSAMRASLHRSGDEFE
jgi:hypothetical protein